MMAIRSARPGKSGVARRQSIRPTTCASAIEPLEGRLLLHAGDRDPSFGLGGGFGGQFGGYQSADTLVDVANGRVVIGSTLLQGDNTPVRIGIVEVDGAGNPIKSFSDDGYKTQALSINGHLLDMFVQPDNKVLVLVGNQTGPRVLARFNADGSLDSTFGQKTITLTDAHNIARSPANGDVIVGGEDAAGRLALVRYGSTGTFKSQLVTNVTGPVRDIAVQGDGKAVVVTQLPPVTEDQAPNPGVVRIKSDFTGLDTTFDGDGIVRLPTYSDYNESGADDGGEIEIDGQGRLIVGQTRDHNNSGQLYRLLPANGALDPTFIVTETGIITDLAVSSNGKITVSGYVQGQGYYLSRYNANGGLDTTYGEGGGLYTGDNPYTVYTAGLRHDVQPDGRVVTVSQGDATYRLTADDTTPVGTATMGSDGMVRITGTNAGNDHVGIVDAGVEGNVYVELNGRQFEFSNATRIEVNTLGGNDRVDNSGLFGFYHPDPATQRPRVIHGGAGNDVLVGAGGKDQLIGEDGNDQLFGEEGDDTIIDGPGTDLADGGLGADTVDYSFRSGPVFVDLQGDADDGPAGEHDTVATSIEQIIGSKGNDTLIGDGRPNYIDGRGGDDTIYGGGGNDTLVGGLGRDKLYGQDGNDFLDAKDGITDLVLDGGTGTDTARKDNSDPRTSVEVLFNG